ncbi:MarR family winged helix-turn-helix transcriptional regulator [Amycolatopsis acidiphila]|uniref:Winged helix-turn-helix transcriptional regulator n=1 Tax=Amycolatopsis acidiphila TaxID=715473 RepID=A0A558AHD7_9PSEU|nr:MarR family winged helix-turn-helix transcriptional regulator [Amycolatopsis acidiphila]TVT23685.1 winged helix-turn-helix transcriptional regulator [Amycolatopsis acidiphila]UIJ58677.1 MarR family winged helix-turn-helix transcriptional regulator [Amycolatopsis acidiphila]GHG76082.1 MarR family transcriptional regulator [Amycolatopsis acidiphila]
MASLPVANQPPHRSGALLDHLARRIRLRSESVLAPMGLRPRHLLALTLLRDLGGSSQQALAQTLEMDSTNIVGLLNDLEGDNLVERRRSPEDRRRHVVELTDVGAKRLAKAEFALAAVEDEVLAALDNEQREQLYALLHQASNCPPPTCSEIVESC